MKKVNFTEVYYITGMLMGSLIMIWGTEQIGLAILLFNGFLFLGNLIKEL